MSNVVNLPKMIKARFCYFTNKGKFYLAADGNMRNDWTTVSNLPRPRRTQISQDNKGLIPGMPGRASEYFIHITTQDKKQTLVLPETTNGGT
jgi:hypothetical protein